MKKTLPEFDHMPADGMKRMAQLKSGAALDLPGFVTEHPVEAEADTEEPVEKAAEIRKRPRKSSVSKYGRKTSLYLDPKIFKLAKKYCFEREITFTQLINSSLENTLKNVQKQKN